MLYDLEKKYEYENGYMATASPQRFSKFISHLEFFNKTSELRGEIVELGVFKGNSLFRFIKFRDLLEHTFSRKIICFDVFGEFPKTNFEDDKKEREAFIKETNGGIGISYGELNELLKNQKLETNVEIIKGDILSTLPAYLIENPNLKISLLHIDVDLFEASKISLESLYTYVVKGGIIILDDYGDFAGSNKAVDEFFDNKVKIKKLKHSHAIAYIEK